MEKTAVYIGRFRPLHISHLYTIKTAITEADKVIILIGSCGKPRDIKNPFIFSEVKRMIELSLTEEELKKVVFFPLLDYFYNNNKWLFQVQKIVKDNKIKNSDIYLYGNKKDDTSFYLDLFKQWKERNIENTTNLNASDVRELLFSQENQSQNMEIMKKKVPESVFKYLEVFMKTDEYYQLVKEYEYNKNTDKKWSTSPHTPIFMTVDAIVQCSGNILMVKRKTEPGKNLWALPGGFINPSETLENSMLEILKNKTKISVSRTMLLKSVVNKDTKIFDHPKRSLRGRIITNAYPIRLDDIEIPKVKNDKEIEAKWFSLSEIAEMGEVIFEDHLDIICHYTGIEKIFNYK